MSESPAAEPFWGPPRAGCPHCRLIGECCGLCVLRSDALADEEIRDLVLWETDREIPAFRVGWCYYRDRGKLPPERYDPTRGLWGQNERVACERGALACKAVRDVLGPPPVAPLVGDSRVWTRRLSEMEMLHLWQCHDVTALQPCAEAKCPLRDCTVEKAKDGT